LVRVSLKEGTLIKHNFKVNNQTTNSLSPALYSIKK
jgi:hypothetical protein